MSKVFRWKYCAKDEFILQCACKSLAGSIDISIEIPHPCCLMCDGEITGATMEIWRDQQHQLNNPPPFATHNSYDFLEVLEVLCLNFG
jgi:hypothetical protein